MKSLLFRYACLVALLSMGAINQAAAQTLQPPTISRIRIEHVGPAAVSEQLIRSYIRTKEGDSYNPLSVDNDVRTLYSTGYFQNVRVIPQPSASEVELVYQVQKKPLLVEVSIEGNEKFSDKRLLKKVDSEIGRPLDEAQLFADAREIREYYQTKGYQKTTVDYVVIGDVEGTGEGRVIFQIDEAPKVKIVDVEFLGVDAFSQRKLRKQIKTRRRWMFSWLTGTGRLKEDQFEEDKQALSDFFREEGYIDFEIRDIELDQISEKKLIIRFILFQGQQYQTGSVGVEGNELFTQEEIKQSFEGNPPRVDPALIEGEVFTPQRLRDSRERIRDMYGSQGYIDANIGINREANTEDGTMDIDFNVQENDQAFIERIEIQGNTKTKDKVIRRELKVAPGEVFDMVSVERSRRIIQGLGFFSDVEATPAETDIDNRKDLVISVEEQNTGNMTFGGGFSSVEQLVGFVEVSQGNFDLFNPPYFTGDGQKFRVRATIGTASQDYVVSFVEPWLFERRLSFGLELYHRDIQYYSDEFDETRTGGKVSLTPAIFPDDNWLRFTVSYTLERVNLDFDDNSRYSPEVRAMEEDPRLVSKPGFEFTYDTRNIGPDPTGLFPDLGTLTKLSGGYAGGPFGGDTDYYKLELESDWYFPGIFDGHTLQISGSAGTMEGLAGDETPLFDRFYLGGLYSLRGFRYRNISPRDSGFASDGSAYDEPVGGNTYWFATAEYTIPIVDNLRFAVFYDIGNVYSDSWSFDLPDDPDRDLNFYSDDWGLGLRLNIPGIGPLRLDYAFPINDGDGFDRTSGRFNFGITTRDF